MRKRQHEEHIESITGRLAEFSVVLTGDTAIGFPWWRSDSDRQAGPWLGVRQVPTNSVSVGGCSIPFLWIIVLVKWTLPISSHFPRSCLVGLHHHICQFIKKESLALISINTALVRMHHDPKVMFTCWHVPTHCLHRAGLLISVEHVWLNNLAELVNTCLCRFCRVCV